jgi:hypothetical protein
VSLFKRETLHFSPNGVPLEPFHVRFAAQPLSRDVLDESWDWTQIRAGLEDGETEWARIAAHAYEPVAGSGFIFLTDRRLFFAWGDSARFVRLEDVGSVRKLETNRRPPKRTWMFVEIEVAAGPDRDHLRIVTAVDARAFVGFYPTIAAARRRAAVTPVEASAEADGVGGTSPSVAVAHGGRWEWSGPGELSLSIHGELVFRPAECRHGGPADAAAKERTHPAIGVLRELDQPCRRPRLPAWGSTSLQCHETSSGTAALPARQP